MIEAYQKFVNSAV